MTDQLHILGRIIINVSIPLPSYCPQSCTITELFFYPSFQCDVLNPKITDVGVGERLAAAVAAMQRSVRVCEWEGHQHWELCEWFVVCWA
jgi:hypothetical protein